MKNLSFVLFLSLGMAMLLSCGSKESSGEAGASETPAPEASAAEPAAEPALKTWKLVAYGAPDNLTQVPADMEITLVMDLKENRVSGKAACNNYNGKMEGTGIGMVISTKMACPPPLMEMETTYLQMLDQVANSSIEGDKMVMTLEDGRQLVFGS